MNLGLDGKVAVIAASSKGLGKATALCLSREGALITINGRHRDELAATAAEIRKETGGDVIEFVGDLADPAICEELIESTVQRRGKLDALICNAGGPPAGTFSDFPDDAPWLDAINLNLMSTLRLSRAAVPYLAAGEGGSITNIVSISVKQPIPNLVLSNTARTAVIGLARSLALELAPKGIRVNSVCPGSILTDRIRSIAAGAAEKSGRDIQSVIAQEGAAIPLGRHGDPEEFGRVVTFFASRAASYVTGVTVQVDGGAYKGLL